MKNVVVIFALIACAAQMASAQKNTSDTTVSEVSFSLKNNSALPHTYTIISYAPNQSGNSTNGVMMGPFGTRKVTYPIGTLIYLANSKQVDTVMSGKSIQAEQPFWEVKAADAGTTINLR